jgi:hypothetical protein
MRIRSRLLRSGAAVTLGAVLLLQPGVGVSAASQGNGSSLVARMKPALRARLSGFLDLALANNEAASSRNVHAVPAAPGINNCSVEQGTNIKVNQNCLNIADPDLQGRSQAQNETAVAFNPNNTNQAVTSYNDYRRGDGTCGTSYSQDGGSTWTDSTAPDGFTRGFSGNSREYWQAGGDTSVAWDTQGNAYLSCQLFNRGATPAGGVSPNPDLSSAFVVFRSTGNGGASWDFPGRYSISNFDPTGTSNILEDKAYMAIDDSTSSPNRDRIYVTWTEFTLTTGYIYEAFSSDYGETFSPKVLVSPAGTQPLCGAPLNPGGGCDNNQFSQPFTAPDGTLYVVWDNYNALPGSPLGDGGDNGGNDGGNAVPNTPPGIDNHQQVLIAKSTDGGQTFGAPVKVGDFYDLPDCFTYQNSQNEFRSCVPEKGTNTNSVFRAADYPSGAVNPVHPSQVIVTYGSYISRSSNETFGCIPEGLSTTTFLPLYDGVKTLGACSNKIVVSTSSDGGATFTGTTHNVRALYTATPNDAQRNTDQWFHWEAFTPHGVLKVMYYDRSYGIDELSGASDISVSTNVDMPNAVFTAQRITTSSLPLPTQFPDSPQGNSQFWGDYAGIATRGEVGYPIWSDTRQPDAFTCPGVSPPKLCGMQLPNGLLLNDQEIYAANAP